MFHIFDIYMTFGRLSNFAPVPVLSLVLPVLSLVVPAVSLVVPVLSLAFPVLSLALPLLLLDIVRKGSVKTSVQVLMKGITVSSSRTSHKRW